MEAQRELMKATKREDKIEGYDESTVIDMYKHPNDYW